MLDEKTKELIAVGSSVAANCHPCIKFHVNRARTLGLEKDSIAQAIQVGQRVRQGAAGEMDTLLRELTGGDHIDGAV